MTQRIPPAPRITNDELDELLLSKGGIFWLDGEHNEWTKELFQIIVKRFNHHVARAKAELYRDRPREIEFGFLCNTDLNAFAYASPSTNSPPFDFIGINVGALFTLLDIFQRILAHPKNFPEVGDATKENPSPQAIEYLSRDVLTTGHVACTPNCSIRAAFASLLTQTAIDFLFFHELSHLRNGHLEYVNQQLRAGHWTEANGKTDETPLQIRQTLEMDADCGAILLALNEAFKLKDNLAGMPKSDKTDLQKAMLAAYGSPKQAVRTVEFSAYVFFRLFDVEWAWFRQSGQSHPLPAIRMFWIGATLYEIFSMRGTYKYSVEEYMSDSPRNILSAETACANIKGERPDPHMIMSVVSNSQHLEYLGNLTRSWKVIRPHLEIHKRGGNLAP